MKLFRIFFPTKPRNFKNKRWLEISIRTIHLIGIAGAGGAYLYQTPHEVWPPYQNILMVSGFLLVLLEIWTNAIWIIQIRGIAVLIKLLLLFFIPFVQGWEPHIIITVIIISGIISHAPGDVRYYSLLHGQRMDTMKYGNR
jgi:hypothetical protein